MTARPRPWPPTNQPGGPYWRPQLGLWRWSFVPPEVRAAALWGVAWAATSVLAGIRVWRAITEHDDETGD